MTLLESILCGTAAMLIPICLQSLWYRFPLWKALILTVVLTIVGTVGTKLMSFVEVGSFITISFYGAVFFVPVGFYFLCKWTKQSYETVLDLCAPAECAMLVIMKMQCLSFGCCAGRIIDADEFGVVTRFPSQMAEMYNAAALCVILLVLSIFKKFRGKVYALYLILYGITRFFLNTQRENQDHFLCGLPAGAFWSVCAVALGVWLFQKAGKTQKSELISQ